MNLRQFCASDEVNPTVDFSRSASIIESVAKEFAL